MENKHYLGNFDLPVHFPNAPSVAVKAEVWKFNPGLPDSITSIIIAAS